MPHAPWDRTLHVFMQQHSRTQTPACSMHAHTRGLAVLSSEDIVSPAAQMGDWHLAGAQPAFGLPGHAHGGLSLLCRSGGAGRCREPRHGAQGQAGARRLLYPGQTGEEEVPRAQPLWGIPNLLSQPGSCWDRHKPCCTAWHASDMLPQGTESRKGRARGDAHTLMGLGSRAESGLLPPGLAAKP